MYANIKWIVIRLRLRTESEIIKVLDYLFVIY